MTDSMVTLGDCIDVMAAMPAASVDAIVTDPPYSLSFMGREWDSHASPSAFQTWCQTWAFEALRILKPGGHLLAFGGTRTYHRLAAGIEDAGFEIRDCLAWLYGSGFPKSLDVSKAIDKAAGVEREVIGSRALTGTARIIGGQGGASAGRADELYATHEMRDRLDLTAPATDDAKRWDGWGTALKTAFEPIVLARKPLAGTVAGNVLEHGTGALNVDGCRVEYESEVDMRLDTRGVHGMTAPYDGLAEPGGAFGGLPVGRTITAPSDLGRWPANVTLDPAAAAMLDAQTGELPSGNHPATRSPRGIYGSDWPAGGTTNDRQPTDAGGASRFFYCAKTSRAERNAGLDAFEERPVSIGDERPAGGMHERYGDENGSGQTAVARNNHPTVKPVALMRWLCRLVTPPLGLVLDPFLGSGTTGIAATLEGFRFAGIERDPDYLRIAGARIAFWREHGEEALELVADRERAEAARREVADSGQLDLLADA